MSALARVKKFFFPRPWEGCSPPAFPEERFANYERRRGRLLASLSPANADVVIAEAEVRALRHLRDARVKRDFDARATVIRKLDPKRLP